MRRNKSQTLLPIFCNEKGQNCNSAQNSLQSSPSKPCRRKLSKKYFQARSSSTALLSFKSEKLSRKYESLSKMMDEFIEGCSKQEALELTEQKDEAYLKCVNVNSDIKKKVDFFFKPYSDQNNENEA